MNQPLPAFGCEPKKAATAAQETRPWRWCSSCLKMLKSAGGESGASESWSWSLTTSSSRMESRLSINQTGTPLERHTPDLTITHPRGVYVVLHEDADSHPDVDESLFPDGWGMLSWNWPFEQSFFYPGAEWFFVTLDHLSDFCPQSVLGSDQMLTPILNTGNLSSFNFHLTELFKCAENEYSPWSEPFPENQLVNVRGIHWYIEGSSASVKQRTPSTILWLQINDPRVSKI